MEPNKPNPLTVVKTIKKLISKDGTIVYLWENKLHNWEGPARIPQGDVKKAEYYLNGIQYSKKEWKDIRKSREGLPWYKQSSNKSRF